MGVPLAGQCTTGPSRPIKLGKCSCRQWGSVVVVDHLTPQEGLYESYEKIRQSTYEDILDTILSKSPSALSSLRIRVAS